VTRASKTIAVAVIAIVVAVTAQMVIHGRRIPVRREAIRIVCRAEVVGGVTVRVGIILALRQVILGSSKLG